MGNNAAFTTFEATVLAIYNRGMLDKALLADLMRPYHGTDIDSGGMEGTLSKRDKLDVVDIVIKTMGRKPPVRPSLPKDSGKWSEEQRELNDAWQDERWGLFHQITDRYGWC